ncbi:hypothetical protein BUALT_Bualt02G0004100 [Buddleja alternifolia]|uniref:F-box domain-containing protein n=1 Tax=Buddleja alternifolia TaxID=168488 RepID=A0AAV6Y4S8_9LAMI|nr:hypothetical protein BUALT_Bualt02G0004100 [Buddleja alternifolia]
MKRNASSIAIMKRKATRRVDVDGSASASLDKISELPQVLLQNIQYFLSPKQAAQTILLSKAWSFILCVMLACILKEGKKKGIFIPSIEWAGVANLKSITICGHANWFHLDNFQVFPNLKDLSLTNVCLSGISSLCDDFWCYFPGLENLKFNNCYGLEEIQISSHSIQHISLTDINRSIKAHFDAPNILSFEYSGKYIPATLSFAKSYSKWKSDIVLELDIVDDNSLWLKQLNELLRGGLSQSKITLDLYKLPNHQQNNNIVPSFEPVEVEELKFSFQKKQKKSSTTVMNDLFRVCRPKNVDVCWYAKEDGKYERKSNEYAEEVFKILMERSQSISTEIINQDYNSPSLFTQLIWQNDLKEVSLKIYDDILHEWRPPLHSGTSLRKCALPDNGYLHEIRFQLKWRRKAGPKPGDVTAKQLFRKKLLISDIGSEPLLLQGPKLEDVTAKQLFRKKLRISDIGPSSNRLYLDIDGDQSLMEFFTEDEKLRLEDGIKVTGLDIVGDKRCYDLLLCSKPGLTMYAGIGEMSFRNSLIKDNIVEIWGSRKDSSLRMVLCFGRYFPRAVIKFFLD